MARSFGSMAGEDSWAWGLAFYWMGGGADSPWAGSVCLPQSLNSPYPTPKSYSSAVGVTVLFMECLLWWPPLSYFTCIISEQHQAWGTEGKVAHPGSLSGTATYVQGLFLSTVGVPTLLQVGTSVPSLKAFLIVFCLWFPPDSKGDTSLAAYSDCSLARALLHPLLVVTKTVGDHKSMAFSKTKTQEAEAGV